ncbi:PUA domain-containing protein [Salinibaculum rarum]|uniref:PUA domain-containing protein n=1 Tax=Salinibaculum rarum TaxID=3058903 RepID=UPI00266012EC|nr:PUA domain-containing protein [Salinibaculum sp. KK48]
MDDSHRTFLQRIADYQFGRGVGETLFPPGEAMTVTTTSSGRPRQVRADEGRLVSYGTDGRFTLGTAGGERLQTTASETPYRVVVGDESEPFVRDGRNVFAKFVSVADERIRPRDEVVVEHEDGRLLAVGRAELSGEGMLDFETGMAVFVREGAE